MPKITTKEFSYQLPKGFRTIRVDINVNSDGKFYCNVPDLCTVYFEGNGNYAEGRVQCLWSKRASKLQVYANNLDILVSALERAVYESTRPVVKEEYVIRYNIESHVSFAIDTITNEIYPNSGFSEDAKWINEIDKDSRYGNHHAQNGSSGGYSLTIGAKAMIKTTETFGETSHVSYSLYYKGGHHLCKDNPAQLLNSWTSFGLPENPREMPYSDKSAMFFYNLMMGIAKLSRMIQDATFDDDQIQKLISQSGENLLLGK